MQGFDIVDGQASRALARVWKTTASRQQGWRAGGGTFGATLRYLKAVAAAGTTDATKAVAKMKELPIDDFYTKGTVHRPLRFEVGSWPRSRLANPCIQALARW
jgi:hypothetical protein